MIQLFLRKFTFNFLPFGITITLLCFLIYIAGQQIYRNGANDPQIEVANSAAEILNTGVQPQQVVIGEGVDMEKSLSLHISVYGTDGNVIASTARLGGTLPTPPKGVLENAKEKGRDIFTWQPATGVRCAAVAVPYANGIILVGKSLRLAEERTHNLAIIVFAGWLFTLLAVAATILTVIYFQFNVLRNKV